ncbi:13419_t:CDS:2 [Acaulospora colombiana]|uniref:13419_t:CDS:1 n=1 Tax=Acaulospora colombiana TaxID=27376 RepID=A0ACA9NT98_9GLOM|nr:13419_t:CDS:2 [Acaulospora colombiana]
MSPYRTYLNHRRPQEPSAFRVTSAPSSRPIGRSRNEQMPIMAITAKMEPSLLGLAFHIWEIQQAEIVGKKNRTAHGRLRPKSRPSKGAPITAETIPESKMVASNNPTRDVTVSGGAEDTEYHENEEEVDPISKNQRKLVELAAALVEGTQRGIPQ